MTGESRPTTLHFCEIVLVECPEHPPLIFIRFCDGGKCPGHQGDVLGGFDEVGVSVGKADASAPRLGVGPVGQRCGWASGALASCSAGSNIYCSRSSTLWIPHVCYRHGLTGAERPSCSCRSMSRRSAAISFVDKLDAVDALRARVRPIVHAREARKRTAQRRSD